MTDDSESENTGDNDTVTALRDTIRDLQRRHERLMQRLSNPTEQMMLAGALAHNAGLRPMRAAITAGEAKSIFTAMIAAMKELD